MCSCSKFSLCNYLLTVLALTWPQLPWSHSRSYSPSSPMRPQFYNYALGVGSFFKSFISISEYSKLKMSYNPRGQSNVLSRGDGKKEEQDFEVYALIRFQNFIECRNDQNKKPYHTIHGVCHLENILFWGINISLPVIRVEKRRSIPVPFYM